jgi:hypothetical protein
MLSLSLTSATLSSLKPRCMVHSVTELAKSRSRGEGESESDLSSETERAPPLGKIIAQGRMKVGAERHTAGLRGGERGRDKLESGGLASLPRGLRLVEVSGKGDDPWPRASGI